MEGAESVVGTCAQGCGCSRLQGGGGRVSAGGRAGQSDRRCLASLGLTRVLYDMARREPGTPPWTLPLKSPLQMPEWMSISAQGPRGRGRKATGLWLTGGPGPAQRGDPSWLPRGSGQTSEPSAARGVSQTLSVRTQSPEIQGPFLHPRTVLPDRMQALQIHATLRSTRQDRGLTTQKLFVVFLKSKETVFC